MRTHEMKIVQVEVGNLVQHPDNANLGDVDAISESIEVNGFFAPLLVQGSTGFILVGNHRYLAACELGADTLPVIYLDVDAEEAKRIMLADNRTARMGYDDEAQLAEILGELYATDLGLSGTGFASDDFEKLLKSQDEPLSFDTRPLADDRLDGSSTQKSGLVLTVLPQADDDGAVYELTVMKEGMGGFTKAEFQAVRRLLGLDPLAKEEIRALMVPQWRA